MPVNVEFKAQTQDLQAGVDRAKGAVAQFQVPMQQLSAAASNLNKSVVTLNATLGQFSWSMQNTAAASTESQSKIEAFRDRIEKLSFVVGVATTAFTLLETQWVRIGGVGEAAGGKIAAVWEKIGGAGEFRTLAASPSFAALTGHIEKLGIGLGIAGFALKRFSNTGQLGFGALSVSAERAGASMARVPAATAAGYASMIATPLRVAGVIGGIGIAIVKVAELGIGWGRQMAQLNHDIADAGVSAQFFQRQLQAAEKIAAGMNVPVGEKMADRIASSAADMQKALQKFNDANVPTLKGTDDKGPGSQLRNTLNDLVKAGNFADNIGVKEFQSATTLEDKWKAIVDLITQAMQQGQRLAALDLAEKFLPDSMVDNLRRDGEYLLKIQSAANTIKPVNIISEAEIARGVVVNSNLDKARQILADRWEPVLRDIKEEGLGFADVLATIYGWIAKILELIHEGYEKLKGWDEAIKASQKSAHDWLSENVYTPIANRLGFGSTAQAGEAPTGTSVRRTTPDVLAPLTGAGLSGLAQVNRATDISNASYYQQHPDTSHPTDDNKDKSRDAQRAAIAAMVGQIEAADKAFKQTETLVNAGISLHALSEDQKTQLTIAAINKREQADLSAIAKVLARDDLTATEKQRLENEKTKLVEDAVLQRQQVQVQALEREAHDWESVLKPIEGAWNAQLHSLLAGTETFAAAMKKIFGDLAIQAIEKLETIGVEKAAAGLAVAFGGPQSALGGLFGGGQAAAQAANTSALTFLTTAITANTVALGGSTATSAAGAAAGAAGGASSLFSGFTKLFSFFGIPLEVGAWNIPKPMAATLHPGEAVVPQTFASGMRAAMSGNGPGGGGDTHVHNWNITAWDSGSVQSWLTRGGSLQLARALASTYNLNPTMKY